jgi:hypothetical protein
MRKFILHTGGFLVSVYLGLLAIHSTLPYFWGNPDFASKRAMLAAENEAYDLIYFGPSAVRREFIPAIFESEMDGQLKAFNFGIPGIYYAEQDYLIRNALNDSVFQNAEYFLTFAQEPKPIQDKHLHRLRISYALDWPSYVAGARYFFQMKNWKQVYRYTIMYLENKLFVGAIFDMFKWHLSEIEFNEEIADFQGYEPYEWSLAQGKEKAIERKKFLKKNAGRDYLKGYRNKQNSLKQKTLKEADNILLNDLIELQAISKDAGKTLIAVFEPNMDQVLGDSRLNSLYFGHGLDYPEYFEIAKRWDHLHLNEEGAIMHTKRLSKLFVENYFEDETPSDNEGDRLREERGGKSKKSNRKRSRKAKRQKRKSA